MKACIVRTFVLIVSSFFSLLNVSAQSQRAVILNPNVYRTRVELKAIRVSDIGLNTIYNDTFKIKVDELGHLDYKIINENENGYVIFRILPHVKTAIEQTVGTGITKSENVVRFSNDSPDDANNAYNYYFAIKADAFPIMGKTLLSTKIVGVPLIHPVKLRKAKGSEGWDLSTEFTVSYSFGLRLKLGANPFAQNFITFIPYGFGLGAAKYFTEKSDGSLTEKTDGAAVTYYQGGILLTLQKINVGVFAGFDAMIDRRNNWFYQGKPWFSFGLGYKFKND